MKYFAFVLFGILLAVIAYFGYTKGLKFVGISKTPAATISTSPAVSLTPTPTNVPSKTVSGGGILSFPKYQMALPLDWSDSKESQTKDDQKLILKKGVYQISITQGGFGGAICLFLGDPDTEGPSGRYDVYVDLTSKSGNVFRRVGTLGKGGFSICEKTQYGWGTPSTYGHISILTPDTPDPKILEEIDTIISSITKI